MKYYDVERYGLAGLEDTKGSDIIMSDEKEAVILICPKPRRVKTLSQIHVRPLRWHLSLPDEGYDSKGGAEVLDMIFKQSYGEEASSPPYFVGSPPVRAANPLIQDSQFAYGRESAPTLSSSSSSSASVLLSPRKGGYVRTKLGLHGAAIRIEGFDCHIPAVS
ncbi:uncharacterized protein G2W53_043154 [Senna tora]|uniref:Uncharacterized protein n=1 Tax=Senna tora TaxID=362788 RepID=A0A834SKC3_9FABA|nr:uncharacterized protein G2W53_043154 [Senna tora]